MSADRDPHSLRVEEVPTRYLLTAGPAQDVDEALGLWPSPARPPHRVEEDDHLVGTIETLHAHEAAEVDAIPGRLG